MATNHGECGQNRERFLSGTREDAELQTLLVPRRFSHVFTRRLHLDIRVVSGSKYEKPCQHRQQTAKSHILTPTNMTLNAFPLNNITLKSSGLVPGRVFNVQMTVLVSRFIIGEAIIVCCVIICSVYERVIAQRSREAFYSPRRDLYFATKSLDNLQLSKMCSRCTRAHCPSASALDLLPTEDRVPLARPLGQSS